MSRLRSSVRVDIRNIGIITDVVILQQQSQLLHICVKFVFVIELNKWRIISSLSTKSLDFFLLQDRANIDTSMKHFLHAH
jgi:hypothetical protein